MSETTYWLLPFSVWQPVLLLWGTTDRKGPGGQRKDTVFFFRLSPPKTERWGAYQSSLRHPKNQTWCKFWHLRELALSLSYPVFTEIYCRLLYSFFFFLKVFIYLFIYLFNLWLCWVFVSVRGLSPVAASGGHSSSRCAGLSLSRPLSLRSTGSRRAGSAAVAHGPSCSVACGIFPDQGSNPCPLHWQADSQPLRHQGSPILFSRMSLQLHLVVILLCCFPLFYQ